MKPWFCRFLGHEWSAWHPKHGRARFRKRNCTRCGVIQLHDVQQQTILEIPA